MITSNEKVIYGKTYRLHSLSGGCCYCVAHRDNPADETQLCRALGDDCLKHDDLYWKEHIGIKKNSG